MPLLTFLRRLIAPAAVTGGPDTRAAATVPAGAEAQGSFGVVLCPIEGEGGDSATAAVRAALSGGAGVLTLSDGAASPGLADDSESAPTSLGRVVQRARALADAADAGVTVCGQMVDTGVVRLRFIPATVSGDPVNSRCDPSRAASWNGAAIESSKPAMPRRPWPCSSAIPDRLNSCSAT